jgi:predicted dehydrogenase
MTRVALFGVSGYGKCLLTALRAVEQQGRCRLVAACIVNRPQESALWDELVSQGVRCFEDAESLWSSMKGEVDLTLLPTPPQTHLAYTVMALEAGSHVMCEKPTSTNLADAKTMEVAAERTSRQLFIGFQDIYLRGTRSLKRDLLSHQYGTIRSVSFLGLWPRGVMSYYQRNSWAGRLFLKEALINDNPVSNAFAHFLNLGLFFSGLTEEASALPLKIEAELFRANDIETFDTAALRIDTDTGIPFHFFCSHAIEENNHPTLRITTDRETLDWKYEEALYLKSAGNRFLNRLPKREEARIEMLEMIIAHLHGEEAPLCTPSNALIPLSVSEQLRSFKVTNFDPSSIRRNEQPGDLLLTVNGLSEKLHRCFEEQRLPAGLP